MSKLIVFEGIDRSGKTTQSKLLAKELNATYIQFPNRKTEIGKVIERIIKREIVLKHEEVHLLFSANRWEMQNDIKNALKKGHVVLDRYIGSSLAYGLSCGLPREWLMNTEMGLLLPDITFYMKIDPIVAAQRCNYGKDIYDNLEFQSKVSDWYDSTLIAPIVIDSAKSESQIQDEINSLIHANI